MPKQKEFRMEGHLQQQSLYLKQFRKRYVILKENHLFCYKDNTRDEIKELIDLSVFKMSLLKLSSGDKKPRFHLIPDNDIDKTRVFAASSVTKAMNWVKFINDCINSNSKS